MCTAAFVVSYGKCLWLCVEMSGLGYARAIYDFVSEHKENVSLHAGDIILILEEVDESWLKGKNHNKVGYVPRSYVEPVQLPRVSNGQRVFLATRPFAGEEPGDLSFDDGSCTSYADAICLVLCLIIMNL